MRFMLFFVLSFSFITNALADASIVTKATDKDMTCEEILVESQEVEKILGENATGLFANAAAVNVATGAAVNAAVYSGAASSLGGFGGAALSALGGLAGAASKKKEEEEKEKKLAAEKRAYYLFGLYRGKSCE